nr:unnamed protein product [Spirometra erinaceieuropaei]
MPTPARGAVAGLDVGLHAASAAAHNPLPTSWLTSLERRCQRAFRTPAGLIEHFLTNSSNRTTSSNVPPSTPTPPPTPTINTDRTPEPPLPSSYSIASTSATAAPVLITTAQNPNTPKNINLPTIKARNMDSIHTCPHCDCTFTSRIGLAGNLRIHHTETGEPVSGTPTYTRHTRTHGPHRPRTFMHLMGLLGHMFIHERGIGRSPDSPSPSSSPTMTSSAHTPPPSTPTTINPSHSAPLAHPPCLVQHTPRRPARPPSAAPPLSPSSKPILTPTTSHVHTVPVHSLHASACSVTCESNAQRLANQCLEHQPTLAASASTVHIVLAHLFTA